MKEQFMNNTNLYGCLWTNPNKQTEILKTINVT